jgi:nickel-dependent lactate racemase
MDSMEYLAEGSPAMVIDEDGAAALVDRLLARIGDVRRVLIIPPDHTRRDSGAGMLTRMVYVRLAGRARVEILPALGTHAPMGAAELGDMFGDIPADAFHIHDWRRDLAHLGDVPADHVARVTGGRLEFPITCALNRRVVDREWDLILSIGQLVPHEVAGMANHHKNVFVGVGGADAINKTHFVGAVCGMEQAMGRVDTPVRAIFQYMAGQFARELPIVYLLTVRGCGDSGQPVTRGIYAGNDDACLYRAASLARQVNVDLLDEPLERVVVYLDPAKYRSAWLGNKAIYRTRMALADGGDLIILAPGVASFGEDAAIDRLIRKYGYHGSAHVLRMVRENADLGENLSAAAHLIHGSTEGRFRVTYCAGGLSREEIESVGFTHADLPATLARYAPDRMRTGGQIIDGKRGFYVADPGAGLWALRARFEMSSQVSGG